MELLCGSTILLVAVAGILVVALLAGAVVLIKLGVFAQLALRQQPEDQTEQVYSLNQSQEAGRKEPARDA